MALQQKRWSYKAANQKEIAQLADQAGISAFLAGILVNRGMADAEEVRTFLSPDLSGMHDPYLMDGMKRASERIVQAMSKGEKILIYGDYDVDGVSSTSILYLFLNSKGADVQYFLPDRMVDGYGLTMASAEKVMLQKADLMITVDCGITSVDEVKWLQDTGLQVIVTDHHECKAELPEAFAVLNPHKPGCGYPFKELCGAGVALKLVQAICLELDSPEEFMKYLDLAALATIADIVPLKGENRIIASHGIRVLEKSSKPGMQALIGVAGYREKKLDSFGVSFGLAPRINAAGRMGDPSRGVRMFTTDDPVLAETLAKELDVANRSRQEEENRILEDALRVIEETLDPEHEKVLVVAGEGWHHGIIGIVASRILDRYHRPTFVISIEEGVGRGSGRSIPGFDLFHALSSCEELMERFGGHEMAAGLTIRAERIGELRKSLNEAADQVLTAADLLPVIRVDVFLKREDLLKENVHELARMMPFGAENPSPVFGYSGLTISDMKTLSGGKHLKLQVKASGAVLDAIGFGMGASAGSFAPGDVVDAVFALEINNWNNTEKLQLNLKDLKTHAMIALDKKVVFRLPNDYNKVNLSLGELAQEGYAYIDSSELVPERSELEAIYRYIRSREQSPGSAIVFPDLFEVCSLIAQITGIDINYFKLKRSLEIFEELGLLSISPVGARGMNVCMLNGAARAGLESSVLMKDLQRFREGGRTWI